MSQEPLHTLLRGLRRLTDRSGSGGLSDAELLERFVTRRDEAAFEVLVWRHGPMVLGVCRRALRHGPDVEDAFQATFLALVRKATSIDNAAALGGWLYKVAYRVALAARAAAAQRGARERPLVEEPSADAPDALLGRDLAAVLDEELLRLPEKYRAAFVLCCLEGKTGEEAARQLGCPRGTVLSRLSRARARLRLRLARRGLAAPAALLAGAAGETLAALPAGLVGATIKAVAPAAAGTAAAGVSAHVAALTEGVLRAMFLNRVKNVLTVVLAFVLAGAGALGTGLLASGPGGEQEPSRGAAPPRKQAGAGPVVAAPGGVGKAVDRNQSQNNLKQIGLALNVYHVTFARLPAPAIYAKDGKAVLSWRVALLPFLGEAALYKQFKLDEPWDGPHNKKLLAKIPKGYAPVGVRAKPGVTYYQAFVGKGAAFEPGRQLRLTDFADGTSNTIIVVEAGDPVPWTKPEDLPYVADQALPRLGGLFGGHFNALFAGGSVQLLSRNADPDALRAAITRAAGDVFDPEKLRAPATGDAGAAAVELLSEENLRLKDALRKALVEIARAKDEVAELRSKVVRTEAADPRITALRKEHAELRDALARLQADLEQLRVERRRLLDLLKGREKPGTETRP